MLNRSGENSGPSGKAVVTLAIAIQTNIMQQEIIIFFTALVISDEDEANDLLSRLVALSSHDSIMLSSAPVHVLSLILGNSGPDSFSSSIYVTRSEKKALLTHCNF